MENDDSGANEFLAWMTGAYAESYAYKISEYCKEIKNCESCRFFNGTCRLNMFPFEWDMNKDCLT